MEGRRDPPPYCSETPTLLPMPGVCHPLGTMDHPGPSWLPFCPQPSAPPRVCPQALLFESHMRTQVQTQHCPGNVVSEERPPVVPPAGISNLEENFES